MSELDRVSREFAEEDGDYYILYAKYAELEATIKRMEKDGIDTSIRNIQCIASVHKMYDWQPIETAPKDGTRILLHSDCVFLASWSDHLDNWSYSGYRSPIITHWMPLPEPPHVEKMR